MATNQNQPIYHLVPASYYHAQPSGQPYRPETFAQEGFIHCTAGLETVVEIANTYFDTLLEPLLVLEIDPQQLTASLKFERPIPPVDQSSADTDRAEPHLLFPHIYGPLNRKAIVNSFALRRDETGRWQVPL